MMAADRSSPFRSTRIRTKTSCLYIATKLGDLLDEIVLAFKDRRWKELSGSLPSGAWATRKIPVCGPGAFTVLKALAFGNWAENKDAYDLFYVWGGVGVADVAESLAPLQPDSCIEDALSVIERDFCHHDGPGPIGTARFITRGFDENIQADVVGYARALLRFMGRS